MLNVYFNIFILVIKLLTLKAVFIANKQQLKNKVKIWLTKMGTKMVIIS